jgi:hypothetical protein
MFLFGPSLYADRTTQRVTPQIMLTVRAPLNGLGVTPVAPARMAVQYESRPIGPERGEA